MGSPITKMLPETDEITNVAVTPLTQRDRCDRCAAQAFAAVHHKTTGHSLHFCGHHFSRFEVDFLGNPAWFVQDERDKINEKPSVSANAD